MSCLEKKGVFPVYIRLIKHMYEEGRTSVRMPGGATYDFYVGMSLHQDSALSPFLFIPVMDELTNEI